MKKATDKLVEAYNNLDLTNPIGKISLEANFSANRVWRYMQENEWTASNKDIIVFELMKMCVIYIDGIGQSLSDDDLDIDIDEE